MKKIFIALAISIISQNLALAKDLRGRLGLGLANPYVNDMPAISMKIQKSRTFALGAVLGISLDDTDGGHGAGLKFYRILFDEPQLSFYSSLLMALVADNVAGVENSGFQVDITLGTEFHFAGLDSIGFSFEFGGSFNNVYNDTVIGTTNHNLLAAGAHFYF